MIAIIVALYSEAQALLEKMKNTTEFRLADKRAFSFEFNGKKVVLAISGIGKVSAALTTQLLIDKYSPDFILNFGTCGGTNSSVKVLNYYIINKCCQYDFDLRELDGVPLGYIQEYKSQYFYPTTDGIGFLEKTALASADKFTNHDEDVKVINDEVMCSICDMEGGAIAQVCTSNDIPLYMIKGITDVHGSGTQQEQFFKNLKIVGAGFPDVIINALNAIIKYKNL